ncbi:Uncharacterised protein [Vibrio cholerae]|nr:Uncharacterised protein [Vibrio cholerae]CSB39645.1 Uncharacterised protein [Vibrio cholerae]CSB52933.1 Uncharacterised protein [Vibrio cholerae]CSC32166.1 Uncharacterised protein [Vibrio cholerae]CSC63891.1 Uncharacterised protein [Vibrio cholerae]
MAFTLGDITAKTDQAKMAAIFVVKRHFTQFKEALTTIWVLQPLLVSNRGVVVKNLLIRFDN